MIWQQQEVTFKRNIITMFSSSGDCIRMNDYCPLKRKAVLWSKGGDRLTLESLGTLCRLRRTHHTNSGLQYGESEAHTQDPVMTLQQLIKLGWYVVNSHGFNDGFFANDLIDLVSR